jgi:tetratricopeptide (TPR) repeat protein
MAKENEEPEDKPKRPQRKHPSAALQQRLQQNFEKGQQNVKQRNFDYATEMFAQCVQGDPGNVEYIKAFIENLQRKYNNNKKGNNPLGLKGMGSRSTLKKALAKEDWNTGIKAGLELLQINPWDIEALRKIAKASAGLGCYDAQLNYLKMALDSHTDPGDVEINRECSEALEASGLFDQAMICWDRVKKHHPNNEEAQSAIAGIHANKMEFMKGTKDGIRTGAKKGHESLPGTREEELKQRIEADPADVGAASELAELYSREDRYPEAEKALAKSLEATGGDVKVREQLEDVQMRRVRHQALVADKRAEQEPTDENRERARQMAAEMNKVELEVFRARSERYPGNTTWKFEYALRLRRAGKVREAIPAFQEARGDPKRKAAVHIELGKCFEAIGQVKLAIDNFAKAIEYMGDRDKEPRKQALYRVGVLAMDKLNPPDLDTAEKYLTELAGLDFGFKDVSERLDKINKMRDGG